MFFAQVGYGVIFAVVFCEALPFFGTLFPGQSTIVAASFAAKVGVLHPIFIIAVASLAIVAGETLSFLLGKVYGLSFLNTISLKHHSGKQAVARIRGLMDTHVGKALFVGRCVPLTRSLTPFVAGAFGVGWRTYFLYGPLGAVVWVIGSVGLGYLFGEAYVRLTHVFDAASALVAVVLLGIIGSRAWRYATTEFSITKEKKESSSRDW